MKELLRRDQPSALETGEQVPSFTAKSINGQAVSINYLGRGPKKALFYFTPTCKFCRKQFAYWRDILEHADANQFEVVGLVRETEDIPSLEKFLTEMGCSSNSAAPLRVLLVPDDVMRSYKLSPTPVTVLVSNSGMVEEAWTGLWNEANLLSASSAMGMSISAR